MRVTVFSFDIIGRRNIFKIVSFEASVRREVFQDAQLLIYNYKSNQVLEVAQYRLNDHCLLHAQRLFHPGLP